MLNLGDALLASLDHGGRPVQNIKNGQAQYIGELRRQVGINSDAATFKARYSALVTPNSVAQLGLRHRLGDSGVSEVCSHRWILCALHICVSSICV